MLIIVLCDLHNFALKLSVGKLNSKQEKYRTMGQVKRNDLFSNLQPRNEEVEHNIIKGKLEILVNQTPPKLEQ